MDNNLDPNDVDLDYVKEKRVQIIDSLTEKGIPKDPKELGVLLLALSDMDKSTLGKKRIKGDKENGNINQQAIALINNLFNDPRVKTLGVNTIDDNIVPPSLPSEIEKPDLIEGELDQNPGNETFDSFAARMNIAI